MSKQDNGTGNVHQLHGDKLTKVEPPETWTLKLSIDHGRSQATYFQKADAVTPLVRIVDVLADFADRHGLPAGAAVDDFLTEVDSSLLDAVYTLHENHFAELVGAGFMYGLDTQAEAEAQSLRLYGYKEASRGLHPWAVSPLEAFKKHIQEHGPQRSDRSLYAINHATANRLWGWGHALRIDGQAAPKKDADPILFGKVSVVLDEWEKWQPKAALSGYLDFYQVLAVLLWWRTIHEELSQKKETFFVDEWVSKIKAATTLRAATLGGRGPYRLVTPLDPVSRLPIANVHPIDFLEGWVVNWGDLDTWFESLGCGRLCAYFFECSQKIEPVPDSKPIATWEDAADLHKRQSEGGKKPAWTHEKLTPITAALKSGVSARVIASAAGIKRQTLDEVVKKFEANPDAYGVPLPTPSEDADEMSGGARLQDAWNPGKAA